MAYDHLNNCAQCDAEPTPGHPGYKYTNEDGWQTRICKACKDSGRKWDRYNYQSGTFTTAYTPWERCSRTNCKTYTECTYNVYDGWLTAHSDLCFNCIDDRYYRCEACSEWFTSLRSEAYCSNCYECSCCECDCSDCYPNGCDCGDCSYEDSAYIHNYSYKPDPIFHETRGNSIGRSIYPTDGTPYLGLELEISVDSAGEAAELLTDAAPGLVYCKEDSSIGRGVEMVTHPMTLSAAAELLPFTTLRTLRTEYDASAWNNGIHVHVSRDGFRDDLHVFRWLKLIYRNEDDVRRIARRDCSQWAAFDSNTRRNHKLLAEKRRGQKSYRAYSQRYSAINTQNHETFEVRVFRGSLRKDEILASLELVAASVEYTRFLSTEAILKADGWTWATFIAWADAQGDTYRNLVTLNTKTTNAATVAA